VQSLHAPEELLGAAIDLAHRVTDKSAPVSIAISRQMLWRMMGAGHPMDAHRLDSRALQSRGQSADVREGISSFMDKRDPQFPDQISQVFPAGLFAPEPDFR
jgi:enoyl-CoA hydratase/carnithine racemase